MDSAATVLPGIERRRLAALARADVDAAGPLHAEDYQLITPYGSQMSKNDYLGAVASGELPYRVFEPISEMAVLGDAPVAVPPPEPRPIPCTGHRLGRHLSRRRVRRAPRALDVREEIPHRHRGPRSPSQWPLLPVRCTLSTGSTDDESGGI